MKSLRILQLQSGGGASGGIAGYIARLAGSNSLKDFSFTVAVGENEAEGLLQRQSYAAAELVEIAATYRVTSFFNSIRSLHAILNEKDIDLIHAHALRAGFMCAFLNLFTGVKFVYTNHGLRFHQKRKKLTRLVFRMLERFVVQRASKVICIRPADSNYLKSMCPPQTQKKIKTIVTRVTPSDAKISSAHHRATRARPLLIGIGSLIEVKRVDRFIDWLAALSANGVLYQAQWLGDGPLRTEMVARAINANIEVSWRGQVDATTVAAELERAKLFLLTSEFEVLSLAALEAMAKGTPIITTEFFGVSDFVVHEENGLVFTGNASPHEVANQIETLIRDEVRFEKMSRRAKLIFEQRFSDTEQMAFEYANEYWSVFN